MTEKRVVTCALPNGIGGPTYPPEIHHRGQFNSDPKGVFNA